MLNGATIPVFTDGLGSAIWARPDDPVPADLETRATSTGGLDRVCLNRHNMAVNVSFFDAHAETVKLGNLWTLKWAAGWSRTTPALVPAK